MLRRSNGTPPRDNNRVGKFTLKEKMKGQLQLQRERSSRDCIGTIAGFEVKADV